MHNEVTSLSQISEKKTLKKVAFHTLGCRLNFSETGSISKGFVERGYEVVGFGDEADVVFINTCTVTDGADSTCRNLIRKAYRSSPEGKIVVAGCYAQMDAPKIAEMQGVDLILGTSEKYRVFEYLGEDEADRIHIDKSADFYGGATSAEDGHTRAFLKIQDGCNYVCSFCIIPQARGRSRAISIQDAVIEGKKVLAEGFKEIVLTGVNIGEYESVSGEKLTDLIKALLELEGLERLRLSSVEPNTITDELLDLLESSPKFLDHFHIPLQSGDDEILKQMKRRYTVEDYRRLINKIVERFPDAGIGADVICGFPGESEEQFQNTFSLLKELPITHFHIFPYSKRKNTIAGRMDSHIQHPVKKERVRALKMFGEAKLSLFADDQVGTTSKVLFERKNDEGYWEGYTTNFVRVLLKSDADLKNQIREVYINKSKEDKLLVELLQ
jgi:threonylcarbamoyladenosine tRNA methylthiotransferase MtaB